MTFSLLFFVVFFDAVCESFCVDFRWILGSFFDTFFNVSDLCDFLLKKHDFLKSGVLPRREHHF